MRNSNSELTNPFAVPEKKKKNEKIGLELGHVDTKEIRQSDPIWDFTVVLTIMKIAHVW